ncbi:hypothetical protein QBC46DRAFT_389584 [Diplogelasinospora grovesii]|uniref:Uncharacterized protein n=1 Tax=Diplogelasinospora grovesii TaxID=303347 RepID=A0AAN6S2G3_9PEZI|nr:hypothetical protein QBC46DRAFT_389584 [Diplogelasinospora grovesii]
MCKMLSRLLLLATSLQLLAFCSAAEFFRWNTPGADLAAAGHDLLRRQTQTPPPGYHPEFGSCGSGTTCENACGPNWLSCNASTTLSLFCYNKVDLNQTCCENGSGRACDNGYYCAWTEFNGQAWCCRNGQNLEECGVTTSSSSRSTPTPTTTTTSSSIIIITNTTTITSTTISSSTVSSSTPTGPTGPTSTPSSSTSSPSSTSSSCQCSPYTPSTCLPVQTVTVTVGQGTVTVTVSKGVETDVSSYTTTTTTTSTTTATSVTTSVSTVTVGVKTVKVINYITVSAISTVTVTTNGGGGACSTTTTPPPSSSTPVPPPPPPPATTPCETTTSTTPSTTKKPPHPTYPESVVYTTDIKTVTTEVPCPPEQLAALAANGIASGVNTSAVATSTSKTAGAGRTVAGLAGLPVVMIIFALLFL